MTDLSGMQCPVRLRRPSPASTSSSPPPVDLPIATSLNTKSDLSGNVCPRRLRPPTHMQSPHKINMMDLSGMKCPMRLRPPTR